MLLDIIQYIGSDPLKILAFLIFWSIPFGAIVKIVRLLIRHANISKHGWPPSYIDADGDLHKNDKDE